MLLMVWRSTQLKTELVTEDYYGEELRYQEQLDRMNRSNKLKNPLSWTVTGKSVELDFPDDLKGGILKPKSCSTGQIIACAILMLAAKLIQQENL
jgi:hypothetical protein